MDLCSNIKASANLFIDIIDAKTKKVIDTRTTHNIVTTAGLNLIRDLMQTVATVGLTHFAVGDDDTAAVLGDTTLGNETAREAITSFTESSYDGKLYVKLYLDKDTSNGDTLEEAGILNAAAAGTLYCRAIYTAIEKSENVEVSYTWVLTWEDDA